ncbi:SDR family oxidoreductase [Microbacterium terregens]
MPEVATTPHHVLVCGVGGITGDAVSTALADEGFAVRALVHRTERTDAALATGASHVVVADYDDAPSLAHALDGMDAVFFVAPSYLEAEPRWVEATLEAARLAGVGRFVYQSVLHAYTPTMPHHERKARAEVAVRASGLDWTVLQPAMYAQTVLRIRARSGDGRIDAPYDPEARFAVVDVCDVGAAVAAVLGDARHVYGGYELVGTEAHTLRELVAIMNRGFGEERNIFEVAPHSLPLPSTWSERQREEYALMCEEYGRHGLLGSRAALTALLGRSPADFAEVVERAAGGALR